MKPYYFLSVFFLLVGLSSYSQTVDQYHYAIVPHKFSIFKEADKYHLNTICKLYLQKYGLVASFDDEVDSEAYKADGCDKLYLDISHSNNLFKTKVTVVLKDCKGSIIATSPVGESREKDYHAAYNEAIRAAFDNFNELRTYKFKSVAKPQTTPVVSTTTIQTEPASQPIPNEPVQSGNVQATGTNLFAKPYGATAFQLLTNDTNIPNYVMTIYKTGLTNCYIVDKTGQHGIVYLSGDKWVYEYYNNGEKKAVVLSIVGL